MTPPKVVKFEYVGVMLNGYYCYGDGDQSGDYVPLADVRALEARVGELEALIRRMLTMGDFFCSAVERGYDAPRDYDFEDWERDARKALAPGSEVGG